MSDFYINPLSVNKQCYSIDDVLNVVVILVSCFKHLQSVKNVEFYYDTNLENRELVTDTKFISSIGNLPKRGKGNDIARLWYLYTKNAKKVSKNTIQTTISSLYCSEQIEGVISDDQILPQANWISFSGQLLNEAKKLKVLQQGISEFTVNNVHNLESLKLLLPRYEPSSKHRKESYYDKERSGMVAAMPLDSEDAQALLLLSIEDGKDRLAYHQESKTFYRFKLTHPKSTDKNIYHGFVAEENEIPQKLITILLE